MNHFDSAVHAGRGTGKTTGSGGTTCEVGVVLKREAGVVVDNFVCSTAFVVIVIVVVVFTTGSAIDTEVTLILDKGMIPQLVARDVKFLIAVGMLELAKVCN